MLHYEAGKWVLALGPLHGAGEIIQSNIKVGTAHLGQSLRVFDKGNPEYPNPMTYCDIKRFPRSKRNFYSKQSCYANGRLISGAFLRWFFEKTTGRRDVNFGIHVDEGNVWGITDAFFEKKNRKKVIGNYVTNRKNVQDIWSFFHIFNGF